VIPPTCTESGYTSHRCAVCDYGYTTHPTAPLNHARATAKRFYPTPSRDGYTLHTCPDCGEVFKDSYVRYADIVTGAYTDNTEILMQGVDTSKWNHEYGASMEDIKPLDWEALKAAGIDFVILKAGSTKGIDPAFEADYRDAKAAGLQVGAYFYTYSATAEDTVKDAEMLLAWLEGKRFELPIYFDMEDESLFGLDGDTLTALCGAFAERLWEEGYYAALYTNTEWLYNMLDTEWVKTHLDVWYARYTATLPEGQDRFTPADRDFTWKDGTADKPGEADKRFGLWQYTDKGGVEGFRYPFDFNFAFKDYQSVMVKWGLNGYGEQNPLPEPSIV
jgi:GH25 family lysozyme M1 (1,4-beta-N-acetylmuramidase)